MNLYETIKSNLKETTTKELNRYEDAFRQKVRAALRAVGDSDPDNMVGWIKRLPEDMVKELKEEEAEYRCIGMLHSILTYGGSRDVDTLLQNRYLQQYIDELGYDRVKELAQGEIDEYNNAEIINDVYTDTEGVSYNSVKFHDDINDSEELNEEVEELSPRFDSRQSFYGKARVDHTGNTYTLISYSTPILKIENGNIEVLCGPDALSQTTMRHVRDFLKQMDYDGVIELSDKDYPITKKWLIDKMNNTENSEEIKEAALKEASITLDDIANKAFDLGYEATYDDGDDEMLLVYKPESNENEDDFDDFDNSELYEYLSNIPEVRYQTDLDDSSCLAVWLKESDNMEPTPAIKKDGTPYNDGSRIDPRTGERFFGKTKNEEFRDFVDNQLRSGAIDDPEYVKSLSDEEYENLLTNTWMKDKDMIDAYNKLNESKESTCPNCGKEVCECDKNLKETDNYLDVNIYAYGKLYYSFDRTEWDEMSEEEKSSIIADTADQATKEEGHAVETDEVEIIKEAEELNESVKEIMKNGMKESNIKSINGISFNESKNLKESSTVIWSSETTEDDYDPEELKERYQEYKDEKDEAGEDAKDFDDWKYEYIAADSYDQWDLKEDDLKENIYPMIDNQINNDILIVAGNYNSNYPDFRPSGKGGKLLNSAEDILNWLSNEDNIEFTNTNGIIGVNAYDHDGSIGGNLYTLPDDKNLLYEIAMKTGYYDDDRDIDDVLGEFSYDLNHDSIDMSDLAGYEDKFIPIKVNW